MSREFLAEFIEIYRQHTSLWKIKSPEYVKKSLKKMGYTALSDVCKKYKMDSSEHAVKKKIQSLRSTFRKEFNKVEKSRSGRGSDDIYSPNLWYFDLMMFTKDQEQAVPSISHTQSPVLSEDNNDHFDEESIELKYSEILQSENLNESMDRVSDSHIPSTPTQQSDSASTINSTFITKDRHRKKRQKKEDLTEHRNLLQVCSNALAHATSNEAVDDSAAFGAYVGLKLKTITDTSQKMLAELLITQVLQKAVMHKLSESTSITDREHTNFNSLWQSHQFNTAHTSSHNTVTTDNIIIMPSAVACDVPPSTTNSETTSVS